MFYLQNKCGEYWTGKYSFSYFKVIDGERKPGDFKLIMTAYTNRAKVFSTEDWSIILAEMSEKYGINDIAFSCNGIIINNQEVFLVEVKEPSPQRITHRISLNPPSHDDPKHPNYEFYKALEKENRFGWANDCKHLGSDHKPKSISEICIEADEHRSDDYYLAQLFGIVNQNRNHYSKHEFDFIKEHIEGYLDILRAKDKVNDLYY